MLVEIKIELIRGKGNVTAYVDAQGQKFKKYYGYYATKCMVHRDFLTDTSDFERVGLI